DDVDAERRAGLLGDEITRRLGVLSYGAEDDSLAAAFGRVVASRGLTVATAESCTGGLLGALITSIPGASAHYLGGAVCYADGEKVRQLGVRPETLASAGAVSEETVREMAAGMRERSGADLAVAVSGIAGPGGGSEDKPVGAVWLALAGQGGVTARHILWPGARDQVRTLAAWWALSMVLSEVAGADAGAGGAS
ncbi:MAG TPA: nicotinamide-nucleotide amidohydrolase family protein, partial [Kofleriaceae bacterium]|nr:nicotinamide-nucleotide amidohydrolase family protein [Kofleriaceae bacterium]